MKKFLSLIIMLFAFAAVSNAQCPSPTFQWAANKNGFTIPGRTFTSDSVQIRWTVGTSTTWASKEGKLHAMSTVKCPNANNCSYSVYFVKVLYPSQHGYGLIDGGQVQVGVKCNGTWIYSAVETVNNLK